jgi:hypothetical protein
MEQMEILSEDKFKDIYKNEKLRNAVAFAHIVCNSNGQEKYKKALMYPLSYKVTEEQIKEAKRLRLEKQKEVLKENEENLLFCGMGMEFAPTIADGVGNHRIRTYFINNEGIKCFIEVGSSKEENVRIDHAIYNYIDHKTKEKQNKYNYKELETKTPSIKYTYKGVLGLVNKYFNCSFKKMVVDYYNVEPGLILCKSVK